MARPAWLLWLVWLAWLAAVTIACSQAPAPETPGPEAPEVETLAPDASAPLERVPEDPEAATSEVPFVAESERKEEEPAPPADRRADDATVISIVNPRDSKPRTLWEAAVAAREHSRQSPPPRITINNDNLDEYQDAPLTFAEPAEKAEGTDAAAEAGEEAAGEGEGESEAVRGEEYWRSTVQDLRLRLRTAVDELTELDDRAAALRRSFYAEDDPYVRDGEIKPAWDRSLDRLEETRRDILDLSRRLEETLEEGRQAGALPGWLREGMDLEPEPDELPRPRTSTHEPGEPDVIEIEPPPGRPDA